MGAELFRADGRGNRDNLRLQLKRDMVKYK